MNPETPRMTAEDRVGLSIVARWEAECESTGVAHRWASATPRGWVCVSCGIRYDHRPSVDDYRAAYLATYHALAEMMAQRDDLALCARETEDRLVSARLALVACQESAKWLKDQRERDLITMRNQQITKDELRDALAASQQEVAEYERANAYLKVEVRHFADEANALRASLAVAQADSKRLDWLQSTQEPITEEDRVTGYLQLQCHVWGVHGTYETVREAIDAASRLSETTTEPE